MIVFYMSNLRCKENVYFEYNKRVYITFTKMFSQFSHFKSYVHTCTALSTLFFSTLYTFFVIRPPSMQWKYSVWKHLYQSNSIYEAQQMRITFKHNLFRSIIIIIKYNMKKLSIPYQSIHDGSNNRSSWNIKLYKCWLIVYIYLSNLSMIEDQRHTHTHTQEK